MNKELQEIVAHFRQSGVTANNTVLATVVDVKGSSYRLPGARMLVGGAGGEIIGTVSGGCLEADVLERAVRVLETGAAEVFTYDTTARQDSVFSLNMGCRGVIRILLERPDERFIDFLRRLYESRSPALIATLIESNSENADRPEIGQRLALDAERIFYSDFSPELTERILPDCLNALREKQSRHLRAPAGEFFLEFVAPSPSLIVFGAGFDAVPLAEIAKNLGWRVTLFDHRAAFAKKERFPKADEIIIARPENLADKLALDETTVAVVMTHNYEHDKNILRLLLDSNAAYIGALGPKRRTANILQEWRSAGVNFTPEQLNRLYAPIGLDIGADTPESIALSIVAEIKSVLSDRAGGFLRARKGSIYNRNAFD